MNRASYYAMIAAALVAPGLASAHATLEQASAEAGTFYKAVMRIGHGCEGSPTVKVRIQMPDGVKQAKPMPKAGWQLEAVVQPLDQSYDWYGTTISEDVREVVWSGGNLPDHFYDEFVFRAKLPDTGDQTLYFKTVQECESGIHRWIEIPEAGKTADDYPEPAPALKLTVPREAHSQ
jgi:uncharacterized protein YcnI